MTSTQTPPKPPSPTLTTPFTRTINLGNGAVICVTEDDIPNPPALSFTNTDEDIGRLNAMWDYTTPHWQDISPLIVKGIRIPLRYWRDLYNARIKLPSGSSWKQKQWDGLKTYYSKWRVS